MAGVALPCYWRTDTGQRTSAGVGREPVDRDNGQVTLARSPLQRGAHRAQDAEASDVPTVEPGEGPREGTLRPREIAEGAAGQEELRVRDEVIQRRKVYGRAHA